jgi:hypothetical protein
MWLGSNGSINVARSLSGRRKLKRQIGHSAAGRSSGTYVQSLSMVSCAGPPLLQRSSAMEAVFTVSRAQARDY